MEISKSRWYGQLYVQVLIGIVIGAAIGYFLPDIGAKLQPFADGFIKLIKMLLAPIIFGTVVVGIAKMGSIKEVGRIGVKALIYFEILSTIALVVGLIVVNIVKPGVGMNINASALDGSAISKYSQAASEQGGAIDFFLNIIPQTFIGAFSNGVMLQIILLSVLMGIALVQMGETSKPLINTIDLFLQGLFKVVAMVMRLAPIGAGAGMAFTIGKYGIGTLLSLGQLLVALYITTLIFIVVVLGSVARWSGMPLMQFLRYFKDEILITLGTCSTEAVLPRMMVKLEKLGCKKIRRGHGVAYGVHLQCGRHLHLSHHGCHLYRPGDQYATDLCGSDDSAGRIPADLKRLGWRGGRGLRNAGCNAHNHPLHSPGRPGFALGH